MSAELARLATDLASAPRKAFPLIQGNIEATLHDIKTDAQADAPRWSGRYARSISYDRNGFKGEVGPTSRYGHLVEDGGANSSPNPVMERAAKKNEGNLEKRIADSMMRSLW